MHLQAHRRINSSGIGIPKPSLMGRVRQSHQAALPPLKSNAIEQTIKESVQNLFAVRNSIQAPLHKRNSDLHFKNNSVSHLNPGVLE